MTSDTSLQPDINGIIARSADLLTLVSDPAIGTRLLELDYEWETGEFNRAAPIVDLLRQHGYVEEGRAGHLTTMGSEASRVSRRLLSVRRSYNEQRKEQVFT